MNDSGKGWLNLIGVVASILTLLLVSSMAWSTWQANHPETHDLTVVLHSRVENQAVGDVCALQVVRENNSISSHSGNQLLIEDADNGLLGEVSINSGEVIEDGGTTYCTKTETIEVEDSEFYRFNIFSWYERVYHKDAISYEGWEIDIFLDE